MTTSIPFERRARSFAGYNAGRGRVEKWIAQYGDPRDANVDPIDWVERIPFAETRNYVERLLENLQVYRTRFAGPSGSPQIYRGVDQPKPSLRSQF
jgi:soluble lytic murein transglycosylase